MYEQFPATVFATHTLAEEEFLLTVSFSRVLSPKFRKWLPLAGNEAHEQLLEDRYNNFYEKKMNVEEQQDDADDNKEQEQRAKSNERRETSKEQQF